MVKIKDFTLASQNRGARAPVPYTPGAPANKNKKNSNSHKSFNQIC